jgi:predicted  nucleic acid-binding Zn-ribbon protein
MPTVAIDTHKLRRALESTGKSANSTADEIADAIDLAQERVELLTKSDFHAEMARFEGRMTTFETRITTFEARMTTFDARMAAFEARMDAFGAKLEAVRADIKSEVKASQMQTLLWLSGIMLAGNGAVIAVLARAARLF